MKDTNTDAAPATRGVDAEHRRLIGVGIPVAFGTFGAVMASANWSLDAAKAASIVEADSAHPLSHRALLTATAKAEHVRALVAR